MAIKESFEIIFDFLDKETLIACDLHLDQFKKIETSGKLLLADPVILGNHSIGNEFLDFL